MGGGPIPPSVRVGRGGGTWAGGGPTEGEGWGSNSRGLGRLGEENGDLRLDKGLAIRPVADLGVEGLHAGAEVRPHQEGDVDSPRQQVFCASLHSKSRII